ncbi:MAG: N-acetyltransferase [Chloroflexi bacterium]|nr:N-acetyltransferase [Chloroflexota bacterium]
MNESPDQIQPTHFLDTINIRPLLKSDLAALEWEGEYTHFRTFFSEVYQKVEKNNAKAWVAVTQDSILVGQVFLQLVSDRLELANGWNRAYLFSFRIKAEYRNRGLGRRMFSILEKTILEMNYTCLTLNVDRENEEAIRLYYRLGFHIAAEEPGIWTYPDHEGVWQVVNEPSWRMEKNLQ